MRLSVCRSGRGNTCVSHSVWKISRSEPSSRSLPLKIPTWPFSYGEPGSD